MVSFFFFHKWMNRVTLVKHLVQVVGLEMWGRKVERRKIEKRQNKAQFLKNYIN